jgi:hypothetical protein
LKRLLGSKQELLRALERPEIPSTPTPSKTTPAPSSPSAKSRARTVSEKGRQARDLMLGLAKTCKKLIIPFFDYLGARLGILGPAIPQLATISPAPS